ncbi:MBL fold metallo-hydrolase [Amycolatopsis benzoatilytica]|uniref:MBL fold metallo-hydrolase n=1 Tax=Amycolatopsis benzoatilytica TaxID=346045 RepID=UPI00035E0D8A|nr:MBL fold metallo-hydrolase [Amycolatopsis benzoatilytica]
MASLTVLGSSGAWPEPGRACAGFLLSHQNFHVVLDLGYGAAANLFRHLPPNRLNAVLVTHEHPDHMADVSALGRAWHYTVQANASGEPPRLPLYCTPGTVQRLAAMEPHPHPADLFDVHDLAAGTPPELGPFRLALVPLPHYKPNFGIRLTAPGLTVAYTGDTGPSPAIADLARDADLLVSDATHRVAPSPPRYLMTAEEAGHWAAQANARRLLLAHFWPGTDRAAAVADAQAHFPGEVLAAEEGRTILL